MAADRDTIPERREAVWLGELIRARRRGRFSLETLARRSGISAGLLSEIERGMGNPSYFTLLKLADALDMEPAEFFRFDAEGTREDHLVRVADRQRMSLPDGHYVEVLSPRLDLPTVVWKAVYQPGMDTRERPDLAAAEICAVVVRGELVVEFQGREECLGEGDAFRIEAGVPYGFYNPGPAAAETIQASTMPPF